MYTEIEVAFGIKGNLSDFQCLVKLETPPSKKNAPKVAHISTELLAAMTTDRRLFGTNITPKTRRMHAEKVQFSAPDRRRFGANFQAAT